MNARFFSSPTKAPSIVGRRQWIVLYTTATVVWSAAALVGWGAILRHTYQPAATGSVSDSWPSSAGAEATAGYHILVFAHPFCPCTQATLDQLDELLAQLPPHVTTHVVFSTVGLDPEKAAQSRALQFARDMKRVTASCDDTGQEAARFGATISGEVFAYDPAGRRIFHGGITAGRGHRGASTGQDQLKSLIQGSRHASFCAPVFGCALPLRVVPSDPSA